MSETPPHPHALAAGEASQVTGGPGAPLDGPRGPGAPLDSPRGPGAPLGGEARRGVEPRLSDARFSQQWGAIEARLPGGGPFWAQRWPAWRWVAVGGALALLGGVVAKVRPWSMSGDVPQAVSAPASTTIALADGSEVVMEDAGILEVVRDEPVHVELLLKQGGGRFRVKPDPARPFVVQAGDVVVTVVGTEFTVAIDPDEVRVSVDHGIVEVERRSGEPRRLLAGESWSTRTEPKHAEAPTSANADEPIVAEAPPSVSATASTNARSLFESANAARRAGNVQLAAQLYRDLVSRFPDDPRAKLAAFELGRLELELGRSDDAEKSLERAASGKAGSAVHEDALAKLVRLYDGRGDQAACRRARDQYLATYPSGVHADSVRKSCSGP